MERAAGESGPNSSLLSYLLLIDSRTEEITAFSQVPTHDPIKLQEIIPIQLSHRWSWLNSVGHKIQPVVPSLEKVLVGMINYRDRQGEGRVGE